MTPPPFPSDVFQKNPLWRTQTSLILCFSPAWSPKSLLMSSSTLSYKFTSPSFLCLQLCKFLPSPHCLSSDLKCACFLSPTHQLNDFQLCSFIGISQSILATSYVKWIDVWMIFTMIVPFLEVKPMKSEKGSMLVAEPNETSRSWEFSPHFEVKLAGGHP